MESKWDGSNQPNAILKLDELRHSGLAEQYEEQKRSGKLFKNGKIQENSDLFQFFINRKKLKVWAKKNGDFWEIAESQADRANKEYKQVDIFASDLHQRRAAHLEYVDNSNAPVYFRSYGVEEEISNVFKIDTGGNMPNVNRGHDITALLAGAYTTTYANFNAANKAVKEGDKFSFMNNVQMAFYDLHRGYRMIEHLTQHKDRKKPDPDLIRGGVPREGGEATKKEKSHVEGAANLYYQNVIQAGINRLKPGEMPQNEKIANDFVKTDSSAQPVKSAIDNMFGIQYMINKNIDQQMLGFKPWEYYWQAYHGMEAYFREIGGDMYDERSAKDMIPGGKAESATESELAAA